MTLWQWVGRRAVASLLGTAVALLCGAPAAPVGAEPRVSVDYNGSRLSVEAHEASLFAVLSEIGAKVGFSVMETAPSSVMVTFSIRGAALDDVLRQLLRAENHTVLYRAGTGGTPEVSESIDQIVLSGVPSAPLSVASSGAVQDRLQSDRPQGVRGDDAPSVVGPATTRSAVPLLQPDTLARISSGLAVRPTDGDGPAAPPATVGDLLKAQAMAAAPSASLAALPAAPAFPASSPQSLDAALAETTRRAQQALGALVDALAKATRSLQESASTGSR